MSIKLSEGTRLWRHYNDHSLWKRTVQLHFDLIMTSSGTYVYSRLKLRDPQTHNDKTAKSRPLSSHNV